MFANRSGGVSRVGKRVWVVFGKSEIFEKLVGRGSNLGGARFPADILTSIYKRPHNANATRHTTTNASPSLSLLSATARLFINAREIGEEPLGVVCRPALPMGLTFVDIYRQKTALGSRMGHPRNALKQF